MKIITQVMKKHHHETHTAIIQVILLKPNATSWKKILQKLPLDSMLNQLHPAQLFTPYISKININMKLEILHAFIILYVLHAMTISTCRSLLNTIT